MSARNTNQQFHEENYHYHDSIAYSTCKPRYTILKFIIQLRRIWDDARDNGCAREKLLFVISPCENADFVHQIRRGLNLLPASPFFGI